jgi:TP901 family phage tail tape measure protein
MSVLRDLLIRIGVDTTNLREGMRSTSDIIRRARREMSEISPVTDIMGKAGMGMMAVGAAGFGAMAAAAAAGAKASIEFSKSMASVKSAINGSDDDLAKLKNAALDLSMAFKTGLSPAQQAEAITELGKAGFTTSQILGGALKGTLSMAAAEGMNVGDAATIAVSSMNQFKKSANDIPQIADTLASGAAASTASIKSLGDALSMVGAVAGGATNQSLQDTVAVLAAFDNAGVKGSDAGTSLKTMLLRLVPTTESAATTMKSLGISFVNSDGSFKKMAEIAGILQTKMSGLTDAQRTVALQTMFGTDAIRAANIMYGLGQKGVEEWTAKVSKQGEAARMMRDKLSGAAGAIQKISAVWDAMKIKFGDKLMEKILPVFEKLGKTIERMAADGSLDKMATNFATGFEGMMEIAGNFITTLAKVFEWYGKLDEGQQKTVSNMLIWGPMFLMIAGGALTGTVKVLELVNLLRTLGITIPAISALWTSLWAFITAGASTAIAALIPILGWVVAIGGAIAIAVDGIKTLMVLREENRKQEANNKTTDAIVAGVNKKRAAKGQGPINSTVTKEKSRGWLGEYKQGWKDMFAPAPVSYNQSLGGANISGQPVVKVLVGVDPNGNLTVSQAKTASAVFDIKMNQMNNLQGA